MVFGPDERAQSTLVGFILLFGILTIAFSSYQAVIVPNQNAEVEFNHFQDVQDDFSEFRSAVINSVGEDDDRSVSFKLGAEYPARLIALNPPPISGQLETTPARPVTVESGGDDRTADVCATDDATSRSLVYRPNYNEFRSPEATSYENTFVSREFTDGNVYDTQRLVQERDGSPDRIDLLLLNGSVSRSSQDSYSVEINSSGRGSAEIEDPVVTIPSRFDADTWENEILDDVDSWNMITEPEPGLIEIEFETGRYRISCAVAGLDGAPEFGPSDEGNGSTDDTSGDFNLQDIRLNGVKDLYKNSGEVELSFTNNNDNQTAIEEARINFYQTGSPSQGEGKNLPDSANISDNRNENSGMLTVGGGFETLSPSIDFAANDESTVWLDFDKKIENRDWFVITLQFEGVGTRQYFVSLRDEADENVGEGEAGLQIDQFDVNDESGNQARFDVVWEVSDSSGSLNELRIVLKDENGNEVDTFSDGIDGTSASGTNRVSETGNPGSQTYTTTLTVIDGDGNEISESQDIEYTG